MGAYWLALVLISVQPPGVDEVAYAFGVTVLAVLTALFERVALGFEVAGGVPVAAQEAVCDPWGGRAASSFSQCHKPRWDSET